MPHSFAHIINTLKAPTTSDLYTAQPITFQTLTHAYTYAQSKGIQVQQFAIQYPEDAGIEIPAQFTILPSLQTSVLNFLPANIALSKQRKLPLIQHILTALYENCAPNTDFLIYTNIDIAVLPNFYENLSQIIDYYNTNAFIVNRRTLPNFFENPNSTPPPLPLMYAYAGNEHPGYDCFVFHKKLFQKFILSNTSIGIPYFDGELWLNLYTFGSNFMVFKNLHLTFHIGDDRVWDSTHNEPYRIHNQQQFYETYKKLNAIQPIDIKQVDWIIQFFIAQSRKEIENLKTPELFQIKTPARPKTSYELLQELLQNLTFFLKTLTQRIAWNFKYILPKK